MRCGKWVVKKKKGGRAKLAKKIHFFKVFGLNMTSVIFVWNIDLFKIVFVEDTFKREKCISEKHFLTKFWSEIVFRKDDFEKYKNFDQKMSFKKTIFTFKSVFHKGDFEWVYISNKHHKSHVWSKNFKKNIF